MEVINLSNPVKTLDSSSERSIDEVRDTTKTNIGKKQSDGKLTNWQKDILLTAINKLENSIQMEDIHPLSKRNAAPIETYEEALQELGFVDTPLFVQEAYGAQANLNPQDVMYLFTGD